MPSLGADMEAGTLVQWLVKPGDRVKRGDIVAVVGTEKADIEVEVYQSGIVEQLLAKPGEKLPVGALLASLRSEAEAVAEAPGPPAPAPPERAAIEAPVLVAPKEIAAPKLPAAQPARERMRISPLARELARKLGIDLSTVQGTGPHGAIDQADVERAAATAKVMAAAPETPEAPPAARPAPAEAQAGMRRAIAAAMARSNREIPHYYLETAIDMSTALGWLEAANQKRSVKERLLPVALLIKAVAKGLGEVPELNSYWVDDALQVQESIHIGFAISLRQGGLLVPAIHNADLKSLDELMAAMSDLIQRTRAGRLRSSEITDGTITITNLGDRGVETVYGVIYPPQVALVGFGRIVERPWAQNGMLGVRPVLTATVAGDHRATDGRRGAQFLEALNKWLQQPDKL